MVELTANISLDGDLCPSGVSFTCNADSVTILNWYLDGLLISYNLSTGNNIDLCETAESSRNWSNFEDFCNNGGSLHIKHSRKEHRGDNVYEAVSFLEITGSYLSMFSDVACGGVVETDVLTLSNFTLSCNPVNTTLVYDDNVDKEICKGNATFRCIGTNIQFIQWEYNNKYSLTDYTNISNLDPQLNSSLSALDCSVDTWDFDDTFANSFNVISECRGDLIDIKLANVSHIGCNSSAGYEEVKILCKLKISLKDNTFVSLF